MTGKRGGFAAANANKTHCPNGHELVEGNLVLSILKEGRRRCLICYRERNNERQRKAKGHHRRVTA